MKKNIMIILLLIAGLFFFPLGIVGVALMWKKTKWSKILKIVISLPYLALVVVSLFIIYNLFLGSPFQVHGKSMEPNFTQGQYLMTEKISDVSFLQRGDVIIFNAPDEYNCSEKINCSFIHRIIGLPGEKVMILNNMVYINGKVLDESEYLTNNIETLNGKFSLEKEVEIPQNKYLLLGDNRPYSSDSRVHGFIDSSNFTHKASLCYWKCNSN